MMVFLPCCLHAQKPVHLMTDLIEHTDRVFIGGRPSTLTLGEAGSAIEPWQAAEVRTARPRLAWAYSSPEPGSWMRNMCWRVWRSRSSNESTRGSS